MYSQCIPPLMHKFIMLCSIPVDLVINAHEIIFTLHVLHVFDYRLGLEYVDLYLMHSAMGGKTLETWDAMIELKRQGLAK